MLGAKYQLIERGIMRLHSVTAARAKHQPDGVCTGERTDAIDCRSGLLKTFDTAIPDSPGRACHIGCIEHIDYPGCIATANITRTPYVISHQFKSSTAGVL